MNKKEPIHQPNYTFQPHAACDCLRLAMIVAVALGIGIQSATAQIYENGSTVLGKTTSEHSADYFNWMFATSGDRTHATDVSSTRIYENQHGPVFFLPVMQLNETRETTTPYDPIDVVAGAPMAFRLAWGFGYGHSVEQNRQIAESFYESSQATEGYVYIDGEQVDFDVSETVNGAQFQLVNREPSRDGVPITGGKDAYSVMEFSIIEALEPGLHTIEFGGTSVSGEIGATNIPVNVFVPEHAALSPSANYTQNFDSLGNDGETVKAALPPAWTVTDEWGFALQRDTDTAFPIATTPRQGAYPYVTNAGVPGEEDRSLSIFIPTNREISLESDFSRIQFLAEAEDAASALQLDFAIEAWDASRRNLLSEPGEAAFHVTVEMDQGDGFEPLLDLGKVTTGVLTEPEEDYLNGNDDANRIGFNSGVLHANIPESAKLRFRWTADSGTHDGDPGNSDGWLFGIDDVGIALVAVGDTDADGEVNFLDFLALADNFGKDGGWQQGDFDGNGTVDFPDFLALAENFGQSVPAAAAAVPEPTGMLLAAFGLLGVVGLRKRR